MKSRIFAFNTYLALLAMLMFLGCKTTPKKEATTLTFHLEENADDSGRSGPVQIGRHDPFTLTVHKQPFLTELNIQKASVVDVLGGFQIMLQFDRQGTWLFEQYSTAAKGKRVAVFSQFGEARWLGAPLLTRRISDGLFVFTPDATREEADRIVRGLNLVAKKAQKDNW